MLQKVFGPIGKYNKWRIIFITYTIIKFTKTKYKQPNITQVMNVLIALKSLLDGLGIRRGVRILTQ